MTIPAISSRRQPGFAPFGQALVVAAISRVPEEPPLLIRRIWRDVLSLNLETARERVEVAEQLIIARTEAGERGCADLWALRAVTLALEDDTLSAAAAAEQALRQGAAEKLAQLARLVLRFCAWKDGSTPPSSADSTRRALNACGFAPCAAREEAMIDVLDLTLAAAIEFSRCELSAAEGLARCALRRAGRASTAAALPAALLGRILYERGEVGAAVEFLRPRLSSIRKAGSLDVVKDAYTVLVGAAAHVGDLARATAVLDEASELAIARNWPRLLAAMLAERVRLCEPGTEKRTGLWFEQLHTLAARYRPSTRCAASEIAGSLFRAHIHRFLKFGIGDAPRAALAQLRHDAWLTRDDRAAAWVKLAEAQLLWTEGDEDTALLGLAEVLQAAATTGLRQILMDSGPQLAPMLESLLKAGSLEPSQLPFAICVLDDLNRRAAQKPQRSRRATHGGDRLSARERDVLKLIGEGCTNKTVAQRRGVAPETVKTHVKNIFIKLGVERRAQAVAKAERLGML